MKPKSQDIAYYIYLDVLSVQKAYGPCPISCFTQNSLIARARNMGHPVVSLKTMSISSPTLIYFLSIFNFFSLFLQYIKKYVRPNNGFLYCCFCARSQISSSALN